MNEQKFPHLLREAALIAERDDDHRIEWLKRPQWIDHPEARKVNNRILDTINQPPSKRMENILLTGESGVGKTTLLERLYDHCLISPPFSKDVSTRPVVMVRMPYKPATRDFFDSVLEACNVSRTKLEYLREPRLLQIVIETFRRSGARVLIIDEINSLGVGTPLQQREFVQMLRSMANDLSITLVCAGTPEAYYALGSDPQMRDRFRNLELPVWKEGPDLKKLVDILVQSKPLRLPSFIDSPQFYRLIASRSNGVISSISRAINYAAVEAIRSGREMIDYAALQDDDAWGRPWASNQGFVVSAPPFPARASKKTLAATSAATPAAAPA